MEKSPDAFRTISEVADWLDTPAHVLRFWESRFSQIRPVKRAGGRRYYRPQDMALLGGIKRLLHDDGLSIRGVQKILAEKGVRHVAALAVLPPEMIEGKTVEATVNREDGAARHDPPEAPMQEGAEEEQPRDNVVDLPSMGAARDAPEDGPADAGPQETRVASIGPGDARPGPGQPAPDAHAANGAEQPDTASQTDTRPADAAPPPDPSGLPADETPGDGSGETTGDSPEAPVSGPPHPADDGPVAGPADSPADSSEDSSAQDSFAFGTTTRDDGHTPSDGPADTPNGSAPGGPARDDAGRPAAPAAADADADVDRAPAQAPDVAADPTPAPAAPAIAFPEPGPEALAAVEPRHAAEVAARLRAGASVAPGNRTAVGALVARLSDLHRRMSLPPES